MRVNMCDACKNIYRPYKAVLPADGVSKEGNAMTIVSIEKGGKFSKKARYDLCPDCMTKVWNFVDGIVVKDQAEAAETDS